MSRTALPRFICRGEPTIVDLSDHTTLIACPHCDALHQEHPLEPGQRAYCVQCGILLLTAEPTALLRVLTLAIAAFILMLAAVSFPFLDLDVQGRHNATSVIAAVLAFSDGLALPLAFAVAAFIIVIPLTRLGAIIIAVWPLVNEQKPTTLARRSFALAERLRPWAMAEIFMVGVTVALIKVAGIATVTIGPAFYAFAALVVITVLKDQLINRYAIWEALDIRAS